MKRKATCIYKMLKLMRLFRRGRRSTDVSELNEAEKGMRALILNIPLFITSV